VSSDRAGEKGSSAEAEASGVAAASGVDSATGGGGPPSGPSGEVSMAVSGRSTDSAVGSATVVVVSAVVEAGSGGIGTVSREGNGVVAGL
jgi:hypothetical protein